MSGFFRVESAYSLGESCRADADVDADADGGEEPVYDPIAEVVPSEVTVSQLADTGVVVSGMNFPAEAVVALSVGDVSGGTAVVADDGSVVFDFVSPEFVPGVYSVVLTSGDLEASTSLTVIPDPVDADADGSDRDGSGGGDIAVTGISGTSTFALLSLILLAAGGVVSARRRINA